MKKLLLIIPQLLIKVSCSHAQGLVLLLDGTATEGGRSKCQRLLKEELISWLVLREKGSTFGSKKTTGFGSRIHDSKSPFASRGLRGTTTLIPGT